MKLNKLISAIAMAGITNSLRAAWYSWCRDRWARASDGKSTTAKRESVGQFMEATLLEGGLKLRFENGSLEIQFLTPQMVRCTWEPGLLPVPYALATTEWPKVMVACQESDTGWQLTSSRITLLVARDGSLEWRDGAGKIVRQELPPQRQGHGWLHTARLCPGEEVYGLGERAGRLNLRGRTYRLWNRDPGGIYWPGDDPLYITIPLLLGRHDAGSYLVFYENSHEGEISLGDAAGKVSDKNNASVAGESAGVRFAAGALRYYLIVGPPALALSDYTQLTGRSPLPPRWALGYHQSCFDYRRESQLQKLANDLGKYEIPTSAIHLDLQYMDGLRSFTIAKRRFPNFDKIAKTLQERHIALVAIIDTGIKYDRQYQVCQEGLAQGAFCKLPDGKLFKGPVWPGICVFSDFTSPQTRQWWGQYYPKLLEAGVRGFWHDMNEPAIFSVWGDPTMPTTVCHDFDGRSGGGNHGEAHNLYALLLNRAGFEALRRLQPEKRPFILTRSGWAGLQRYAWTWTGDSASTWENLRQTVATVLGLGLSGIPYSGPDIGGFNGTPSAELYTRWLQLATFLPFCRSHGAFTTPGREPWYFGEPYLTICRNFLRLRYRLLPYLYTLAWEASCSGAPLVRPLFWPDLTMAATAHMSDAFLLGNALLVVPVCEEQCREVSVYLPPDGWYCFWDNNLFEGGRATKVVAPLERLPLFVRAGTVLPLEEDKMLILHIYPPLPGQSRDQVVYSDAGDGYGPHRLDRFHLAWENDKITLDWEASGDYPFPYATVAIVCHQKGVRRVWLDGREVSYTEPRLTTGKFHKLVVG